MTARLHDAMGASSPAPTVVSPDVEASIRMALWLGHGHGRSLYGDDGEMQCVACMPIWDYRRLPLAEVAAAALSALRGPIPTFVPGAQS